MLEFDQEPWMEPYIRMNTEFRKQAKSDLETDFYKLMNNSVFGKNNGESAQPRGREDSAGVGGKQDPQAGLGPTI